MRIQKFSSSEDRSEGRIEALREIFFISSSRQIFSSSDEKEEFFARWTGYYFQYCSDHIYLAIEGERLLGYLMGCPDSQKALSFFRDKILSYALFADQFKIFPAHLHINCRPETRGHGVGTRLIETFCEELADQRTSGVHIVTSPDSRNRGFYSKNKFTFELQRSWKDQELLFMGRRLLT